MTTRRAVLPIAHIGGYTDYIDFHRSVLGHAEGATTRMLDKVVERVAAVHPVGVTRQGCCVASISIS